MLWIIALLHNPSAWGPDGWCSLSGFSSTEQKSWWSSSVKQQTTISIILFGWSSSFSKMLAISYTIGIDLSGCFCLCSQQNILPKVYIDIKMFSDKYETGFCVIFGKQWFDLGTLQLIHFFPQSLLYFESYTLILTKACEAFRCFSGFICDLFPRYAVDALLGKFWWGSHTREIYLLFHVFSVFDNHAHCGLLHVSDCFWFVYVFISFFQISCLIFL